MSIPKNKIDEMINNLKSLNSEALEQIVILIKDFKARTNSKEKRKPSDYLGALKHLNIDIDEECRKLRAEWNRDIL